MAVSLSRGGTESGDVHLYETGTGRQVHEIIPRVNGGTAGGDPSHTRFPARYEIDYIRVYQKD